MGSGSVGYFVPTLIAPPAFFFTSHLHFLAYLIVSKRWLNGPDDSLFDLPTYHSQCSAGRPSPRAHLHAVGMLRFMSDIINQPSLPTHFDSVLVSISVFMALSTVFHSINSPDSSPFFDSVLPVLFLCLIGPFNCISL